MPNMVEGQSFSHSFFSPKICFLTTYSVAGENGDSVFHLFPKISIECLLCDTGDGRLVIYSFVYPTNTY